MTEQLEAERQAFEESLERGRMHRAFYIKHGYELGYGNGAEMFRGWLLAKEEAARSQPQQSDSAAHAGWDAQAYTQMRDDFEGWKQRALDAEQAIERLRIEESPTFMGEPALCAHQWKLVTSKGGAMDQCDKCGKTRWHELEQHSAPRAVSEKDVERATKLSDEFDQIHGAVANHLTDDEQCVMDDVSEVLRGRVAALESLAPAPTISLSVALNFLEEWALAGGNLTGDDAEAFRAIAQKIAPTGRPTHWAAIDEEGNIYHSYSTNDGNDGEAARQEMNDWINENRPRWHLVPIYASPQPAQPSFQARVADWMSRCFIPSLYSNITERGDRLLEEVLELLQATGYDRSRVGTLADYVYGRPVGEPNQEAGGVMVTLAGFCWIAGLDMHEAGAAELARITKPDIMAKIREKQEAKNALHFNTPLSGNAQPQPAAQDAVSVSDIKHYKEMHTEGMRRYDSAESAKGRCPRLQESLDAGLKYALESFARRKDAQPSVPVASLRKVIDSVTYHDGMAVELSSFLIDIERLIAEHGKVGAR